MHRLQKHLFSLCLLALFIPMGLLTVLSFGPHYPVWRFVALIGIAHVPYCIAIYGIGAFQRPIRLSSAMAAAVVLRVILLPASPVLSDDIYRYEWDGQIVAAGINPYSFAPDDEALVSFRNENWQRINNKELRTIYPPAAQALFGGIATVSFGISGFKLVSIFADVCLVFLLFLLAGGYSRRTMASSCQRDALQRAMLYGLNPLVCVETAMSGHLLEPAALALTVFAVYRLSHRSAGNSKDTFLRELGGAAGLSVAIGFKLAPALIFPALGRRRNRFVLIGAVLTAGIFSFSAISGLQSVETLDAFARRWESNAGIFALVKTAARSVTGAITGTAKEDDLIHISALDPVAKKLNGTFLSMHKDGDYPPMRPATFTLGDISLTLAKLLCGLFLVGVIVQTCKKKVPPVLAGLWIFGTLVLVTPVLHPWYLIWVLPFAAIEKSRCWFVFAAFVPLSYLALDPWWQQGEWRIPSWVPWVEYASLPVCWCAHRYYIAFRSKNS